MSGVAGGALRVSQPSAPRKALIGTAAVALLLAGTRWASYIGSSPLFLTDVLIALAVLDRMLGRGLFSGHAEPREGFRRGAPLIVVAILGYVVARMLLSGSYVLSADWFRDGAPYLYVVLALLSAHAVAHASASSLRRTMTWIWWALLFHLAWVVAVGVIGEKTALTTPHTLLGGGIFNARPDIDSAVLGITAGLLLRRVLIGQRRWWSVVGLGLVVVGATSFSTRSGLIAVAVCLLASFLFVFAASGRLSSRSFVMVLLGPVVVLAAVVALPSTTAGSRLIATIEPGHASSSAQLNALGTTEARKKTWSGVIDWTTANSKRELVGAGMGIDFLSASGTLQYLEGTDYQNVRSPHDYFIGSFARLGLVGVGMIVIAMLMMLRSMVRFRRRIAEDELLMFAALAVAGLVTAATFGVILEAPFGAVPFWWAGGIMLALTRTPPVGSASDAADVEAPQLVATTSS